MKMNDKIYDALKWIALVAFPAFIALYTALSGIWGWPYGEQIIGTLAALEVFLGAMLQVSSSAYKKAQTQEVQNDSTH